MGFPRADIDRAVRAAFFNPDRAVEYLLNVSFSGTYHKSAQLTDCLQGIPENIQQEQRQARGAAAGGAGGTAAATTPAAQPATGTTPTPADPSAEGDQPINLFEAAAQANRGGAGGAAGRPRGQAAAAAAGLAGLGAGAGTEGAGAAAGGLGNLDFLRNNDQFRQLREIVQTQPRMLEPILQQVGAGNPQLAQLIGQNPDQFLQLLSEDADGDAPMPPGAQEISVTEDERAAIERVGIALPHNTFLPLLLTTTSSAS